MAALASLVVLLSACGTGAAQHATTTSASSSQSQGSSGPSASFSYVPSGPSGSSYQPSGATFGSGPNGCPIYSYGVCIPLSASSILSEPIATNLGFSCRIAVSNGEAGAGGFINVPGGEFTLDPRSNVTIAYPPGTGPGNGPGQYPSNLGLTYSAAVDRWFPVAREAVTPDGSRYAFTVDRGIHVINVTTGADTLLGADRSWRLLLLTNSGAYATASDHPIGLSFLPFSGTPTRVTESGSWVVASGDVAYGQEAPSVPSGAATNPILRLSLASGSVQRWWADAAPNAVLLTIAPDGSLLLSLPGLNPALLQFVDVRRISQPDRLESVVAGPAGTLTANVVADSRGVWLSMGGQYYQPQTYFSSSQGIRPVSKVYGQLASGCD